MLNFHLFQSLIQLNSTDDDLRKMERSTSRGLRVTLGDLPAVPLDQIPKVKTVKPSPTEVSKHGVTCSVTPPSTPPQPESDHSVEGIATRFPDSLSIGARKDEAIESNPQQGKQYRDSPIPQTPKLCHKKYHLHKELGHGVWSTVFYATEAPDVPLVLVPDGSPPSPPTSPKDSAESNSSKAVAIKKPRRRDAHKILRREANILTYLDRHSDVGSFVVPFHGFCIADNSLVLDVVPYNLEAYTEAAKQRPLSTKTMFDPIIGGEEWLRLARSLVNGLAFLHENDCIHGDIKPSNILLRLDVDDKLLPLYCDFSSSRIHYANTSIEEHEEISAVTTDFTSPELLEALQRKGATPAIATAASDVFALAVTLLSAATGQSPYACLRMECQKLAMAKEGLPLEYARRGEQASRVMKGKLVETILWTALERSLQRRCEARAWKERTHSLAKSY